MNLFCLKHLVKLKLELNWIQNWIGFFKWIHRIWCDIWPMTGEVILIFDEKARKIRIWFKQKSLNWIPLKKTHSRKLQLLSYLVLSISSIFSCGYNKMHTNFIASKFKILFAIHKWYFVCWFHPFKWCKMQMKTLKHKHSICSEMVQNVLVLKTNSLV